MKAELISGKERVKNALAHKTTARPPVAYNGAEPQLAAKIHSHYGVPDELSMWLKMGLDFWPIEPSKPPAPVKSRQEQWAAEKEHPLQHAQSIREIEAYFREAASPPEIDYTSFVSEKKNEHADKFRFISGGSLFEAAWHVRGFSTLLEDFYLNPELADTLIEHFLQGSLSRTESLLQAFQGTMDMVFLGDDLGAQRGLIFSVDIFRKFFKPRLRKMIELAHRHKAVVVMHSCGSVAELIPEFIDVGLDILNPVQISADGMDPSRLKGEFGQDITFWGGVDIQTVLREQTPKQIRKTVRFLIETLGTDGGYICAPTHVVLDDTPLENLIAFFEEALRV